MSKPYDRSDAGHLDTCAFASRLAEFWQEQRQMTETQSNEVANRVQTQLVYGQSMRPQAYAQPGTLFLGFLLPFPAFFQLSDYLNPSVRSRL